MIEIAVLILGMAVSFAVTYVLIDVRDRRHVKNELDHELFALREALKKINETHNNLMQITAANAEIIEDLKVKLSILQQGISPVKPFGGLR